MKRVTTAEAIVESLLRHGIDTLYAVPGVHNDHLFDAVYRSDGRMRVLHPRHEQTSAYMALGAALATGRPQVCAMVPGPGVLNASSALLTALGTCAPVIALAGQIPSDAIDRGYGHLHELRDQLGLMRHFTKFAARISAAADAPQLVAEAVRQALSGKRGPVALECAIDTWGREGIAPEVAPLPIPRPSVDDDAIEQAARLLANAQRPIIVAGGGALDATAELLAVAEALQAPVMTFRRGRGAIPTDHPLAVSFTTAHRLWKDADAVLGVGTRMHLCQSAWGTDDAMKIVRIDIDPEEHFRFRRPDCAIIADAADGLRALHERLARHNRARPTRDDVAAAQAWFTGHVETKQPQMDFLRAIRAALPDDGIVIEDVTQLGFVGRLAFPVAAPRRYISPGYQDNLGWAYGAALGAQAALPDRAVVAMCGDGGFMYQAAELATAVRHKLPVVAIVVDDSAFGNVKRIQEERFGNRLIAWDLANPDFFRFAESFGARAYRAETPAALQRALTDALAERAPALIHVPVGEMPSPWDMLALPRARLPRRVARFAAITEGENRTMQRRDINASDAPAPVGSYTHTIEVKGAERTVYISGQVGIDRQGNVPPDVAGQARNVWANLEAQLRAVGMTLDNIVKMTTILPDRADLAESRKVREEVMGSRKPASTLIVAGLVSAQYKIEIEVIACA